jgi:hypothetical protein
MAAGDAKKKYGSQWLFADVGADFAGTPPAPGTAANSLVLGTPTSAQLDTTSLANGVTRVSAKTDLGAVWPALLRVDACLEFAASPTDATSVTFYWASSPSGTAANANAGGLAGVDADLTETAGILGQFTYIGSLTLRANATNIGYVGTFSPDHRYGQLVVYNTSGTAFIADAVETHITATEVVLHPAAS